MGYLHITVVFLAQLCLASAVVYSYCNLDPPQSTENQNIVLDTAENVAQFGYPRGSIERALARDSAARDFVRSQARAANASRAVGRNPQRAAAVGAPSDRKYDTPMEYKSMCGVQEAKVLGAFDESGDFCYVVGEQFVPYYLCANAECDVANPFPFYQKYYCAPESFRYNTAMVWCSASDQLSFYSFDIPVQCVCRKFSCNLDNMGL